MAKGLQQAFFDYEDVLLSTGIVTRHRKGGNDLSSYLSG